MTRYELRAVAEVASDAWDTAQKSHKPILKDCSDALIEAAEEIERLQAIIDMYPKTTDGVSMTPGMTLWYRGIEYIADCIAFVRTNPVVSMNPAFCSSTREAVKKARKT